MNTFPYKVLTLSTFLTFAAVSLGTPIVSFANTQEQVENVSQDVPVSERILQDFTNYMEQYYQITVHGNLNLDDIDVSDNQKELLTAIKEHQNQSKEHATFWKNELNNKVLPNTLTNILASNEQFQNEIHNLTTYLGQESVDKHTVVTMLQNQNSHFEKMCTDIKNTIAMMQKMSKELTTDITNYDTDKTKITSIYDAFTQSIEHMIAEKDKLIDDEAGGDFIGRRPILVPSVRQTIEKLNREREELRNQLRKQIQGRTTKMEVLSKAKNSLTELIAVTNQADKAMFALSGQFQRLKSVHENIIEHVEEVSTINPKYITIELNTVQQELNDVNALAKNLKGYLTELAKQQGFSYLGDKTYYLNEGSRVKGWYGIDTGKGWNKYYIFDETTGEMKKGIVEFQGKKYGADPSTGVITWGWGEFNGKRYYFSPENASMQTDGQIINGEWYYFCKKDDGTGLLEGEMASGWTTINKKQYYLGKKGDGTGLLEGQFAKNITLTIDGKTYTFDENGHTLPFVTGKYYFLESALGSHVVVDMTEEKDGGNVALWENLNGTNQKWKLEYNPVQQAYQIVNERNSNLVLSWENGSGTNVVVVTKNDSYWKQGWIPEVTNDGYFILKNKDDQNKVLDVSSSGTENGTNIQVYDFNDTNAQKFKLK